MRANYKEHNPTTLIILGATGDLTRRKLIPALFRLHEKGLLPPLFQAVGFSRQTLTSKEFQRQVVEVVDGLPHVDPSKVNSFVRCFAYTPGFFDTVEGYKNLAKFLGFNDNRWNVCSNKLFYLAVPPQYYKIIFRHLASSGLTEPCSPEEGWTRVVVEKPFGNDSKTAEELDTMLGRLFKEEQIYRIDHYLGKETVQNILAFRFSNSFLDPAWNNDSIESIHIQLLETGGVDGRGEFYDETGALRDVGQNHLLQLLALFTMKNPGNFDVVSIRKKRAEILQSLPILTPKEVAELTRRGQYEGYRALPNVNPTSKTETYFRITTFLSEPQWSGIPLYLESGKKLNEAKAEVAVQFKHKTPCLCPPGNHYQNTLRYQIQPKEKITTSFWVKKPGSEMVLEEKDFSFDYQRAYPREYFADAYERLLLNVIRGDQTLFVSTEEIAASWRFIDPIVQAWKDSKASLVVYALGSSPAGIAPRTPIVTKKITPRTKELAFIGLGKMGMNMVSRLLEKGWRITVFDKNPEALAEAESQGARRAHDFKSLIVGLGSPRVVWLMIPAGRAIDEILFGNQGLASLLTKGDIVIDGGNSFYEDSVRRAKRLARSGIRFLDVGVSGGPSGAKNGASLMIGGEKKVFEEVERLFQDLATLSSYSYLGKSGAGHFVKMVHNGIEYGMMQAIAEGFAVMKKAPFKLDLQKVADVYNHGSVIESRLINWLKNAYREYGENLKGVSGSAAHTGEGEWTVKTAKHLKVPTPVIEDAFRFRLASKKNPSYIGKILSALRNQFGGHSMKENKK